MTGIYATMCHITVRQFKLKPYSQGLYPSGCFATFESCSYSVLIFSNSYTNIMKLEATLIPVRDLAL